MEIVTIEEKKEIFIKLEKDIEHSPEDANELNTEAIKKIYKSEVCPRCKNTVSMLSKKGLCGCCEWGEEQID